MPDDFEILLVDDDPLDIRLTLYSLAGTSLSQRVVVARDGEEALERILGRAHSLPCLVLLDLNLPRIDGLEVLRALKADPAAREIPVVIMTSYPEQLERLTGNAFQGDGVIRKPLDLEQLGAVLARLGLARLIAKDVPAPC